MFSLPVYIKGAGKDKPEDSRSGVAAGLQQPAAAAPMASRHLALRLLHRQGEFRLFLLTPVSGAC